MIHPRWRTVLTVVPYLVLAMLVVFSLLVGWGDWVRLVPELVLCAAYGLWVLGMRALLRRRESPAVVAVFMTGLIAINFMLVLFDSWFAFLTIATFTFAYSIVPWPWELLAVAATAVIAGIAQSSSLSAAPAATFGRVVVVALNVIVMCGLSWGLRLADQQLQRAATEAERSRLAREIHDTLAQGFAGIVTQLQAAQASQDAISRDRHTESALSLARDGLAEARRSVQALRPAALESNRLPEAIVETARRWSERTGIPVDVSTSAAAGSMATDAEVALLRAAQEALANVERHAHAHRVTLTFRHHAHRAQLEIRDDGRGFDPESQPRDSAGGGFGLIAMRERIAALAGDLVVESSPGRGTAIRVEVPG
ncbi:sensor histidine kinase [Diaminobutyricibacter sp. McL0608]|uniref:sensor histidine kinase n=1 Tax=Leifsonia sp. McL0608 TaxID=3143537 RepID=UPI0031F2FD5A